MSRRHEVTKSMVRRRRELAVEGTSDLFELIKGGSAELIVEALAGLPEGRRREIGSELVAWVKAEKVGWWSVGPGTALTVAAVGCLPSAAQAAPVVNRRSVTLDGARAARLVRQVAADRGIGWLGDLAYRMAGKLSQSSWVAVEHWRMIATLLRAEGLPPPAGDRFVELWVVSLPADEHRRSGPRQLVLDRLRTDPFLPALLPRLFEVDGLGTTMMYDEVLTTGADRRRHPLPAALAQLAGEGVIDRAVLIDGSIGRLLRGDRPAALRAFTTLLDQLQPTPAEVAERRADYLRLLADAPAPVASMAQKVLRELPDQPLDELLDTSHEVLLRPDKVLVRAQLAWLDRLARQHRDRAVTIAEVIAVAVEHDAVEIRDRATTLATRHGATPAVVTGGAVAMTRGDDLPAPTPPAAAPAPITDVDELAEEVAALLGTDRPDGLLDRIVDGLVRLTATDGPRVRAALDPVVDRRHWSWANLYDRDPFGLQEVVVDMFRSAGGADRPVAAKTRWGRLFAALHRPDRSAKGPELVVTDPRVPPPHRLLKVRLIEIGHRLGDPCQHGLLSTPTSVNGMLDPFVLLDRLAARGDREPWRWDLTQALLRLPTGPDDQVVAGKAAALGTPAGDRLAAWLRTGGLPQPVMRAVTMERRPRTGRNDWAYDQLPLRRVLVELRPPEGYDDRYGLLTADPAPLTHVEYRGWPRLWPSILPGHRGAVAAYALPEVAAAADLDLRDGTAVLPLLVDCAGAGGVAVDLALAYGLGARHGADRIATVDALLGLAAGGRLDATGVGEQLGRLVATGQVKLSRAVEPLRDAATAGAPLTVWRLLAAALPTLLTADKPPRGLPDLLTLAAETATRTGVRIEVPGLADVAGRGGTTRLVTEARRLHRALIVT
ncbi:DUF6493 family protein [Micromonospora rifamycinica]|uniref:Secreted protein n=1 Tax=Micromonospora rifamycinica TaxID=291594 RepID=A0A1C5GW33_9ACTN|nr:DUF6493 family protein [Micromonospora rifamycinica]SCG37978.1 hypothetical protein GA0070623_0381 [Micromonospora rifamycinica]